MTKQKIIKPATGPRQVSLALTHYNRYEMLLEAIAKVIDDPRIGEIVISDDCSMDGSWDKLNDHFMDRAEKVKLFRNFRNYDCYQNKRMAVALSTLPWVILFDSDNILTPAYLDALYALPAWESDTIYCPEFAEPSFDYREFSGHTIDQHNVAAYVTKHERPKKLSRMAAWTDMGSRVRNLFTCCLNTANYFVHRESWLSVWDGSLDPITADTIFQSYNWLRSGRKLHIVPALRYYHRIHNASHFINNEKRTGNFHSEVVAKLKALK